MKQVYGKEDGDISVLSGTIIGILGYGNQGRAQALNMRDSGCTVIIGVEDDTAAKAEGDGFDVLTFEACTERADVLFFLLPDEVLPEIYAKRILPTLEAGQKKESGKNGPAGASTGTKTFCFASGYNIAFEHITPPAEVDVILLAPRMIGVGVRETYLTGEGFFSFIGVHQNSSGRALETLLALAKAIGTLKRGAVTVTMKQEALLDLFNEQAFGPAFGRVLLTAVDVLLKSGLPPEAVLTEMYMSEEMAFTYRKMARVGIVNQLQYHSHTSQYGAMSRGVRYMDLPLRQKFQRTFKELDSGAFAREWQRPVSKLKLKVLRFFAVRQRIGKIESDVRKAFGMHTPDTAPGAGEAGGEGSIEEIMQKPEIKNELEDDLEAMEF
jgi:ketol-acid reductoisomerase